MPSAAAYSSPSVLRTPLIAKAPKSSTQVPDHPSKIASPSALSPSLREPSASDEDGLFVYASEWPLVPAPNPTPAPPVSPWALVKKKTRKLTDELVGEGALLSLLGLLVLLHALKAQYSSGDEEQVLELDEEWEEEGEHEKEQTAGYGRDINITNEIKRRDSYEDFLNAD